MLRAAERVIRQASTKQVSKVSTVTHMGEHIDEFGIDNHQSNLLSLVVSVFLKLRLHHIAKLTSLDL